MEFNKQTKNILLISILYFFTFKNIAQSQESNLFSGDLDLKAQLTFDFKDLYKNTNDCLLYTSPSPRDQRGSRMPGSA
mgnify:CR=1 FL=1